jgi:hypothetical protein
MSDEAATGLKITVWRSYTPTRPLAHSANTELLYLDSAGKLQQDVFSWQVHEDVWGGIVDQSVRQALSERLVADFDPFLAPEERNFRKLKTFLVELQTAATSENSSWSISAEQTDEDDDVPARLNALLALYNHLLWMHEVFKDLPGASVTVR